MLELENDEIDILDWYDYYSKVLKPPKRYLNISQIQGKKSIIKR
jgi:hypothetical protein